MPLEDKQLRRRCEREIAKFPLDLSRMSIRALNNVIYFEGRVRLLRGAASARGAHLDKVLESLHEALMQVPGVREVSMTNLIRDY
ncbi:MAG: hypothetical protein ACUVX8_15295 [Candidatus Zipacnadales bacterium]